MNRTSVTTTYAHNAANEYTTIGSRTVSYDHKGNFERDINGSWTTTYTYDHDNRLKKIEMDNGLLFSDRARFEYDALGRMISSYRSYDAGSNGKSETLKFYHDGANVLAEYDLSNNLSRRHVHGTRYVDERAVLLEGGWSNWEPYYYLLQELDTVTGLVKKNGTLAEAYTYDAYGIVNLWGYRDFDFDRDGDVDSNDYGHVLLWVEFSGDGNPTSDPGTDGDMDGDTDENDLAMVQQTSSGAPPITLHASGVGNPYFFTGRRLHLYQNFALSGINPNKQIQYNRARHYSPEDGRWLQRDPIVFASWPNLYQYVRGMPTKYLDPSGLVCTNAQERCTPIDEANYEWVKVSSLILSNEEHIFHPLGMPAGYVASYDAWEKAWWKRDYRRIYKCQIGCMCVKVYGTVGKKMTTTQASPDNDANAGAEGVYLNIGDFLSQSISPILGEGGLTDIFVSLILGDIANFRVLLFWINETRNYAPNPLESENGSVIQQSGPVLGLCVDSNVNCTLQFPSFVFDLGPE